MQWLGKPLIIQKVHCALKKFIVMFNLCSITQCIYGETFWNNSVVVVRLITKFMLILTFRVEALGSSTIAEWYSCYINVICNTFVTRTYEVCCMRKQSMTFGNVILSFFFHRSKFSSTQRFQYLATCLKKSESATYYIFKYWSKADTYTTTNQRHKNYIKTMFAMQWRSKSCLL